jgi:hypothetical protein
MEHARPEIRFLLYAAAACGVVATALLLASTARDLGESGAVGRVICLSVALVFYAAMAVLAGSLCRSQARRAWMAACAFTSLAVAALGAGPGGVVAYSLPTAILMWLAVRGKLA